MRSGRTEPWAYGPYRVVAQRRVSEEEQLSVECYTDSLGEARATLAAFLEDFRGHMRAYNEQVVLVQQTQLEKINAMIDERGEEVRRLERELDALTAKKLAAEHPDAAAEPPDADESR
jgi:uncharacterized coiled-coil protein SlyX